MNGTKSDTTDQMIHLWKRRTGKTISREDAKEMMDNVAGFFHVLLEWDGKLCNKSRHQKES